MIMICMTGTLLAMMIMIMIVIIVMAKNDEIDDVSEVENGDEYDDDGDDRDVIIMDSHCLPRGSCERNELLPTYTIIKTQQWTGLHKYFGFMNTSPIDNLFSEDIIRF